MAKKVSFGKENMEAMLRGLNIAADVVGGTIGPKGKNVYLMDDFIPDITNDGVKIANRVTLENPQEDAGAYVIRNVSSQQNDDVGDGTTTVTILTQSIVSECLKRPENVVEIKESLQKAGQKVLKILSKKAKEIKKEDIESVALISGENKELAKIITEIFNKLGKSAVINVEDSKTFGTEYEIVDGYEAKAGFMSPYFINDAKTGKSIHEDIPVFVSEKRIANVSDIQSLFEKLKESKITKCAIVCDDIADDMLGVFVVSKVKGLFDGVVIKAIGDTIKDIASATGATAVSDANGLTFQNVGLEHLGRAKKLIADKNISVFVGDGISSKIRATELEKQAENEPNQYLRKMIQTRVAQLRGGIAILKIGAPTDFEREYLKSKAEDAVKATKAALEEGIVEGGGMALWRISQELTGKNVGEEILSKALKAPLKRIIENCGKDYTEVVVSFSKLGEEMGYNAKEDSYVNLIEKGILDPVKVERCAVENSISSASHFITALATIYNEKETNGGK